MIADARRAALLICLLGLRPGAALAQEHRLENGGLVVVESRPASETVAIRLIIGGGDLDDPADRPAVSRLHAAMLLRGTVEKTGFTLAREAEELGGRLSASSRPLAETIALTVPAESSESAMRLIVETFLSPRLDPADLAKEKDLLAGEIATERDQPSTERSDAVYREVFGDHTLARLALPSEKEIRAIGIEDIRAFHRARMAADRLALLVVGHCDAGRTLALAERLLQAVPPGPKGRTAFRHVFPSPAPLSSDRSRHVSKRTTQPEMTLALPTAGVTDDNRPAFALLSHVLGGFQERLYTQIREKHGWAYAVDAGGENFPGAGLFEITMGAEKTHFDEIEDAIRKELERIGASPVSQEELRRAVRYLRTAEARRDATNSGRASVLSEELLSGSPLRTYQERVERLAAVTADEVQALARRLFAGRHVAVVTMY